MMWLCGISFLLLTIFNQVHAGYNSSKTDNLVMYYGQNSWGDSHSSLKDEYGWQGRLEELCNKTNGIDVINIAFLIDMKNPTLNLANLDGPTDLCSNLTYCENMEKDIKTCQDNGKDILLSIGGQKGYNKIEAFTGSKEAKKSAQDIWNMFGPLPSGRDPKSRPFGKSEVNGFDLDIEDSGIGYLPDWAVEMRRLTANNTILLTASPECSHHFTGEVPMTQLLNSSVKFDYLNVQFYNNDYCWANSGPEILGSVLDDWAKWSNKFHAKWLVGLAAGKSACKQTRCYQGNMTLFDRPKNISGFAGGALWDWSQSLNNEDFHIRVKQALTKANSSKTETST